MRLPTDGGAPPRRLMIVISVAAVVVLLAALMGVDVTRARLAAGAAQESLQGGLSALQEGDLAAAERQLAAVSGHVDDAKAATRGVFWRLAATLPVLSPNLDTAATAVAAADAATALASGVVAQVGIVANPDGTTRIRDADGNLDLGPIEEAAAGITGLDTDPLQSALEKLASTPSQGLVGSVQEGRDQMLLQGRRLLSAAQDARTLSAVLPSFLGADQPREYFLAMQNLAESRGTGGLIGFFATVRVSRGRIELTQPQRYEVLDQAAPEGEEPPVIGAATLPAGFLDRYGAFGVTSFLANANLDPDLPTVANVLLNLYEQQRGRRLDGVIAMDPVGLAYANGPVGNVDLPPDTPSASLPLSIPPNRLAKILMVDAYDVLGGPSPARKVYLARVAESAFRGITSGQWSALDMTSALTVAAGSGHLQLYSTHPDEQAAFASLDVAGRLDDAPDGADFLSVTKNNSAGNKSDVHVAQSLSGTVDLQPKPGDTSTVMRTEDLQVAVGNPLPTEGRDIYIIGSSKVGQGFQEAFTDRLGLNRTWFTVWAPASTTDVNLTNADGRMRPDPPVDRLHGLLALDYTLETPSKSVRQFGASVTGPVPVQRDADGALRYQLWIHRQSQGIPDRLNLTFRVPDGWSVQPVAVTGGGQDPAFGPFGDPGPSVQVTASTDRTVVVTGDMTRDVSVELRLVPVP